MDELLIEEKKYISSKQAAKVTGYAKDYIGQLCREGRVPARLVGRSWYVLETAIQDHRFGNEPVVPKEAAASQKDTAKDVAPSAKDPEPAAIASVKKPEVPHYEAYEPVVLPTLNRLRTFPNVPSKPEEPKETPTAAVETPKETTVLEDSWKTWFDATEAASALGSTHDQARDSTAGTMSTVEPEEPFKRDAERAFQDRKEDMVSVPIRIMGQRQSDAESVASASEAPSPSRFPTIELPVREPGGWLSNVIRLVSVLIALFALLLAALGSGYLDTYSISVDQVHVVSGISVYNR